MTDSPFTISRKKRGKGFCYVRQNHKLISRKIEPDKSLRQWIQSLAIPPAWVDVCITDDTAEKIYAFGRDAQGKKQYIYNPKFASQQQAEKFNRLPCFAMQLTRMRLTTGEHLNAPNLTREKVLACMLRLIDIAYFRPGNEQYTKLNESYGLTTLRSRHLTDNGKELSFEYVGKSGVEQKKTIENTRLKQVIRELDATPGYRVFKYFDEDKNKRDVTCEDINEYIRCVMGQDFTAKDFRTWAASVLAAQYLLVDQPGGAADNCVTGTSDKSVIQAVKKVSQKLGNTPAVCRQSYIDPRVIRAFEEGKNLNMFAVQKKSKNLSQLSDTETRLLQMFKIYGPLCAHDVIS